MTRAGRTGRRARGGRGRRRGVRPARFEPRRLAKHARALGKRGARAQNERSRRHGSWSALDAALAALGRRTRDDCSTLTCRSRPAARACAAAARRHRQPRERAVAGRSRGRPAGPRPVRALGRDRPAERCARSVRAATSMSRCSGSTTRDSTSSQIIRGLRGEDSTPRHDAAARPSRAGEPRVRRPDCSKQARVAIGDVVAGAGQLAAAETAAADPFDKEAGGLLAEYRRLGLGGSRAAAGLGSTPLILLAIAVAARGC